MVERTCDRLRELPRETGGWIVGQAMVLAALVGEFGLQKQIGALHHASVVRGTKTFPHPGFKIMATLVCRIDGSKPRADRQLCETRSAVLFPCGAIDESRSWR